MVQIIVTVRAGIKGKIRAQYRIGYWAWKGQLEALLNHKLDWMEMELVWAMYDSGLAPWAAFLHYKRTMVGGVK